MCGRTGTRTTRTSNRGRTTAADLDAQQGQEEADVEACRINGWRKPVKAMDNIDAVLGRRFKFIDTPHVPEFTVVAYDRAKGVRVHATDGGRWWLPLDYFQTALYRGLLTESSGKPFAWEHGHDPTVAQQAATRYTEIPKSTMAQLRRRITRFLKGRLHGKGTKRYSGRTPPA